MTRPSCVARTTTGVVDTGSGNTVVPPPGCALDDLVIWVFGSTTTGSLNTISTPSGFNVLYALEGSSVDGQIALFYRFAPSGFTGAQTFVCTTPQLSAGFYTVMWAYRDVSTVTPFETGTDSSNLTNGASGAINMPTLTAYGSERLAVAFSFCGASATIADPTGESGGDWIESAGGQYQATTGDDGTVDAFETALDSATVSGGSVTPSVSTGGWACRGLILRPIASAATSLLSDRPSTVMPAMMGY